MSVVPATMNVWDTTERAALATERDNLEACVRCGLCLEGCPTYVLTRLEEESPRGRIAAALAVINGHVELTEDLTHHQLSCLLCEACTAICPAGVEMMPIGTGLRTAIAEEGKLPMRSRAVNRGTRILGERRKLTRAVRLLGKVQGAGLDRAADRTGFLRPLGVSTSMLPPVPERFVEPDGGGWRPQDGRTRGKVRLFTGCLMSTLLAPITEATGELLASAGFEVERTQEQTCCGALSAHEGDSQTAIDLMQRNAAAFSGDTSTIVVNSAGCSAHLKLPGSSHDSPGPFARSVMDLSEFLADVDFPLDGPAPDGPVAYQDACHARLAQGIIDPPRQLLRRIPDLKLIELADPELCCGSAGTYNLTHVASGRELGDRKAREIIDSGAVTVVTANPGCLLQVQASLKRLGSSIPVLHLAEVLRAASTRPIEVVPAPEPGS